MTVLSVWIISLILLAVSILATLPSPPPFYFSSPHPALLFYSAVPTSPSPTLASIVPSRSLSSAINLPAVLVFIASWHYAPATQPTSPRLLWQPVSHFPTT